jgi:hypothetical protein
MSDDLDRAVEEAQKALWAAEEAARQAEFAKKRSAIDAVFAEHKATVDWATGLRLAILDLHGPRRDDLEPPSCGVCFNSHGYEVQFPCPTYILARDWEDES